MPKMRSRIQFIGAESLGGKTSTTGSSLDQVVRWAASSRRASPASMLLSWTLTFTTNTYSSDPARALGMPRMAAKSSATSARRVQGRLEAECDLRDSTLHLLLEIAHVLQFEHRVVGQAQATPDAKLSGLSRGFGGVEEHVSAIALPVLVTRIRCDDVQAVTGLSEPTPQIRGRLAPAAMRHQVTLRLNVPWIAQVSGMD